MEMTDVISSNIASIGYDKDTRTMRVFFKRGGRYVLDDVPPELYEHFLQAESPGRFYAQNCAGNFKYHRLGDDE